MEGNEPGSKFPQLWLVKFIGTVSLEGGSKFPQLWLVKFTGIDTADCSDLAT